MHESFPKKRTRSPAWAVTWPVLAGVIIPPRSHVRSIKQRLLPVNTSFWQNSWETYSTQQLDFDSNHCILCLVPKLPPPQQAHRDSHTHTHTSPSSCLPFHSLSLQPGRRRGGWEGGVYTTLHTHTGWLSCLSTVTQMEPTSTHSPHCIRCIRDTV